MLPPSTPRIPSTRVPASSLPRRYWSSACALSGAQSLSVLVGRRFLVPTDVKHAEDGRFESADPADQRRSRCNHLPLPALLFIPFSLTEHAAEKLNRAVIALAGTG